MGENIFPMNVEMLLSVLYLSQNSLEIIKQDLRNLRDKEPHSAIYNEYDQVLDEIERLTDMIKVIFYKRAYHILMEYWDSLPDERKAEIDKKLKEMGL